MDENLAVPIAPCDLKSVDEIRSNPDRAARRIPRPPPQVTLSTKAVMRALVGIFSSRRRNQNSTYGIITNTSTDKSSRITLVRSDFRLY